MSRDAHVNKDPLLDPYKLKNLTLRNRIMSTSHACGLEEGGLPRERYQRYHEEKAKGGIALTMFGGSSNVAPDSPNIFRQLDVSNDQIVPYLREFSERIHRNGAALMCQITHLGRRGEPYAGNWLPTIGASVVRETAHRSFPKQMDEHDINRVVKAYGAAAKRCSEGGLDGIETLCGGHLIGQFLSPLTNRRTDRFGGSLENRCRFGIMVHEEIRRQVSKDFLVGIRFVIDEGVEGGLGLDESIEAARILAASGGIDFFNAIYGRMDTERGLARENMPGMDSPIAPWIRPVGSFKAAIGLPVFHAARIPDAASARYAIREGLVDMVGMTRANIADPHLVAKLREGREAEIRPCVGATHCMSVHRPACLHNPATGREADLPHRIERSPRAGLKVVVVGGGPAGLEAARVSAERGHDVVLFEAAAQLGGQVLIASQGSWRRDIKGIIDWRAAEIERLRVRCHLNRYAEMADVLAESPDAIVVATGGIPEVSCKEGADLCTSIWDVLTGAAALQDDMIIYDGTGRHPAALCTEKAVSAGKSVQFVSIDSFLAAELTYAERVAWKSRFYSLGVPTLFDHHLARVSQEGGRIAATFVNDVTLAERTFCAAQIVAEQGTMPVDDLFQALRPKSTNDGVTDIEALLAGKPQPQNYRREAFFELHRIGDAVASRNIAAAVLDALRLCSAL